jgi:hypothetical protein
MREAAMILAVSRIVEAVRLRGYIHKISLKS